MARVCKNCGKRVNILDWVFHQCKKTESVDVTEEFEINTEEE
jgi:hypothetical protein